MWHSLIVYFTVYMRGKGPWNSPDTHSAAELLLLEQTEGAEFLPLVLLGRSSFSCIPLMKQNSFHHERNSSLYRLLTDTPSKHSTYLTSPTILDLPKQTEQSEM